MFNVTKLLTVVEEFSTFRNLILLLVLAAGEVTMSVLVAVVIFEKDSLGVTVPADQSIQEAYTPILPADPVTS